MLVFARAADGLVSVPRPESVRTARSAGLVISANVGATPKPGDRIVRSCGPRNASGSWIKGWRSSLPARDRAAVDEVGNLVQHGPCGESEMLLPCQGIYGESGCHFSFILVHCQLAAQGATAS